MRPLQSTHEKLLTKPSNGTIESAPGSTSLFGATFEGSSFVEAVTSTVHNLLIAIGEDPARAGLAETPLRVARFWDEFVNYDPGKLSTSFEDEGSTAVGVSGMRVWSVCEHHLLPFWADISLAYRPKGKVLGLSKFARIAHKHAHRLQLQERLVSGIRDEILELTGAEDVIVHASGVHTCMVMRGIRTDGLMTSTAVSGAYEDPAVQQLFFSQI